MSKILFSNKLRSKRDDEDEKRARRSCYEYFMAENLVQPLSVIIKQPLLLTPDRYII